jgi:hypothetical protein
MTDHAEHFDPQPVGWEPDANTDWMRNGACRGSNTNLFFPEQGGDVRSPKAVCADCPVKIECAEYAIPQAGLHGVWGGLSERERRNERARRIRADQLQRHPIQHGTPGGYRRCGLQPDGSHTDRCAECKEWNRIKQANLRERRGAA